MISENKVLYSTKEAPQAYQEDMIERHGDPWASSTDILMGAEEVRAPIS